MSTIEPHPHSAGIGVLEFEPRSIAARRDPRHWSGPSAGTAGAVYQPQNLSLGLNRGVGACRSYTWVIWFKFAKRELKCFRHWGLRFCQCGSISDFLKSRIGLPSAARSHKFSGCCAFMHLFVSCSPLLTLRQPRRSLADPPPSSASSKAAPGDLCLGSGARASDLGHGRSADISSLNLWRWLMSRAYVCKTYPIAVFPLSPSIWGNAGVAYSDMFIPWLWPSVSHWDRSQQCSGCCDLSPFGASGMKTWSWSLNFWRQISAKFSLKNVRPQLFVFWSPSTYSRILILNKPCQRISAEGTPLESIFAIGWAQVV